MRKTFLLLTGILAASTPAAAQSTALMPEPFARNEIGVEVLRPFFDESDGLDLLSFASYVYGRYAVTSGITLVADLPWARVSIDGESNTGIGNIMVGAYGQRGRTTLYGTVHLPTASDDFANLFATLSELPRMHVWVPDITSVSLGGIFRDRRANGHGIDAQLGAVVVKPDDGDWEMLLEYGAQYVYRPSQWGFTGGIQGLAFATTDGDFGERTFHDLRLRVDYTTGRWRPAIGLTLPFDDDLQEAINGVLRLGLQVGI